MNPNIKKIMLQNRELFVSKIGLERYNTVVEIGFKDRLELREIMKVVNDNKLTVEAVENGG